MSDSKTIPVRMPLELYEAVIASKPAEVRVSTYLLMLVRRGLNVGVENLSTNVEVTRVPVDINREIVDNTLISSLQSQIAGLEEGLRDVQKVVDNNAKDVDKRIEKSIQQQMGVLVGESKA